MSLSNQTEIDVNNWLFRGVAPSWAANSNFWIALHTADPGEAGTATTSEAAYGSYARVQVTRSTGFTADANPTQNAAQISFPECTSGSETITHMTVVTTSSGAGQIIARAALGSPRSISSGIQPIFNANTISFTTN